MFHIEIDTANAAFGYDRDQELARILRKLAGQLEDGGYFTASSGALSDFNGNRVGTAWIEDES